MKRKRCSVEQIIAAVKQNELGTPVPDIACKLGVAEQTVSTLFMLMARVATAIAMQILARHPLVGESSKLGCYFEGSAVTHALGFLSGFVRCTGTVFNYFSAGMFGVTISVDFGSSTPMIGALWGVDLWREFEHGSITSKTNITLAMFPYTVGVTAMSLAYTHQLSD